MRLPLNPCACARETFTVCRSVFGAGEGRVQIPADTWDDPDFASDQPFTQREAYTWLLCRGPQPFDRRRLALLWQWRDRKRFTPFLQRMIGQGLMKIEDGFLSAVQADEAVSDPGLIVGDSWRRLRLRVFIRDGFRCTYCGAGGDLHCDHVIPRSRGGLDIESNLTTSCRACNLSKGARTLDEWRGRA